MPTKTGITEIEDRVVSTGVSSTPAEEKDEPRIAIDLGNGPLGRSEEDLKQDMASILQSIKLPTREHTGAATTLSVAAPVAPPPPQSSPQKSLNDLLVERLAPLLNEGVVGPPAGTPARASPPPTPSPEPLLPPRGTTSMLSVMPAIEGAAPPTTPKKEFIIPSVHTLKDDLQDVVSTEKISAVKAAALEAKKREQRDSTRIVRAPQTPKSHAVAKTMLAALLLLLIGAGALLVVSTVQNQRAGSEGAGALSSIMFAEQTLAYPIDGKKGLPLRQELALARTQIQIPLGAIARIASVTQNSEGVTLPVSALAFLTALEAKVPQDLANALSTDYFFGVHSLDQNLPVLVLPITDYEHAFSGMLAWEKSMSDELRPLFSHVPAETVLSDGTLLSRKFEDVIIQNYDVRVLKDATGTVRLLYSFPTRNFLIITESPNSFVEILVRLRADRRL